MEQLTKQLAACIRRGDTASYASLRYPRLPDGEDIVFTYEDFSYVDFSPFIMGFMVFKRCKLNNAKILGQPITIIDSSATGMDLRGVSAIIESSDSNFSGMRIDNLTTLAQPAYGPASCSHFTHCNIDYETTVTLRAQGVRID